MVFVTGVFLIFNFVTVCNAVNTPPTISVNRDWQVPENMEIGSRVIQITASDADNDRMVFEIHPINLGKFIEDGSPYFTVNPKTGTVQLEKSLQGKLGKRMTMYVAVDDGHRTTKLQVVVHVTSPFKKYDASGTTSSRPSWYDPQTPPFYNPNPLPLPPPRFPPSRPSPYYPTTVPPPKTSTTVSSTSTTKAPTTTSTAVPSRNTTLLSTTTTPKPILRNNTADNSKSTSGSNMALIITLIALGILLPVAIVIFCYFKKQCAFTRHKDEPAVKKELSTEMNSLDSMADDTEDHANLQRTHRAVSNAYISSVPEGKKLDDERKWEFPRHHLRVVDILGEGCFGQVWKCEALNINGVEGTTTVAVKTLKENAGEREKTDLVSELKVMKMLDPHPNVVTLLGCCTLKDPTFVIMEYVSNGKLQSYLRQSRASHYYKNLHGISASLTSRDLTSFAYQVAKGMEYLSSKKIIHRDLAARNILIGENRVCKVSDFGFARDIIQSHVYERKSEGCLPIRWMAPESLYDNMFTCQSDVWSFGILMWEIVTLGSTPYPGQAASDVMKNVRNGYRLERPEHCKREIYNLMYYCWDKNANDRPSFSEIVQTLDEMLLSETDYIELERFPEHSYYNVLSHHVTGERV